MEELLSAALAAALRAPVVYADVRIEAPRRYEHLAVQNGDASALTATLRSGIGVRVRTRSAWGFATTAGLSRSDAREAGRRARQVAVAASRSVRPPLEVAGSKGPSKGEYASPVGIDPFGLDLSEKIELLIAAEAAVHTDPSIKTGHASFQSWQENKFFASSEGTSYHSRITHVGAAVHATAVGHGEVQRRCGPTSFGGDFRQAGWEYVQALDLVALAPTVAKEAVALLTAPACPKGPTTVVLGSDQLALQVHESVGHATELDRILGMEAGYAGRSFVHVDDVDRLRYGSPLMNIVADATEPGGLGTFGWDDEGVPAQRTELVVEGRLKGFLTSRETAARIGSERSGGTARAEGAHRAPLIRMTNINLLPGDHSFEELLEGVQEGVFLLTNRSWSIDDKRLNFQFGTEVGRRIVKGELGEIVRNPLYSGMTPEFWGSMDAVGDAKTWHLWGVPNCGKGQPGQIARVSHGAPAARFRSVEVRPG
jgi:TldD protein